MTYEADRISYQSSEQAARAFHKRMMQHHNEIQALKAQIEKLSAQSPNIIKADFLDWIRQEIVLSDDVDIIADWMLGKAFGLRQEALENDNERII
jgi:hypothetical protein